MKLALGSVKVVEYGDFISAPYCGKLLADMGAEVIKVEPIAGDSARRHGPFLNDVTGKERSGLFLSLNTNKLGVTLNPKEATGGEIFKKLVKDADILIEDSKPGMMESIGLGYEDLKKVNPALVMTSLTPFGQTGPYKDYKGSDLIAWHMGGAGYITPRFATTAEQEPLRVLHMASFITGISAAMATICSYYTQHQNGFGQQIDVSQLETMVILTGYLGLYWPYEHRSATRVSRSHYAPYHFLKCADGWVQTNIPTEHHWQRFIDMMGNPEWSKEQMFLDSHSRAEYWESLEPLITEWTMKYSKAEIFEMAKAKRIPLAPVNSLAEVVESTHLRERNYFIAVEHPEVGKLTYPGAPYKFSGTPWAIRRPAPLLGEHNREIYCNRLGYTESDLVRLHEVGLI